MIKQPVCERYSNDTMFVAEIDCEPTISISLKIGLAVEWAVSNGVSLSCAYLSGAHLVGANLTGANLTGAHLVGANLTGANLTGAHLLGANLHVANLTGANLTGATLVGATLVGVDLSGARLCDTDLTGADLHLADLCDADLCDANLSGVNLNSAYLCNVTLAGVTGIRNLIIDMGIRSDGWRHLLTRVDPGGWRIKAGCRDFTVGEALEHWRTPRSVDPTLDAESTLMVEHGVRIARLRGWPEQGEEEEGAVK